MPGNAPVFREWAAWIPWESGMESETFSPAGSKMGEELELIACAKALALVLVLVYVCQPYRLPTRALRFPDMSLASYPTSDACGHACSVIDYACVT